VVYQVIIRKSDGAIMDCRPGTPSIQVVLEAVVFNERLRGKAEADADGYHITTSETPVEVWQDPVVVAARAKEEQLARERELVRLKLELDKATEEGYTDLVAQISGEIAALTK
jgi:hypothetical protein